MRGTGRTRILYWFRTPPGVRVGRAALDEDAIRLIEANNPDLEFDWTRILKGQADPEIVPASDRRDRRPERDRQPKPASERRAPRPVPAGSELEPHVGPQPAAPVLLATPIAPPDEPMTPAHARLGFEGLVRLRARHSETLARITERVPDPDQQAQLKILAERLNPDAWVTDADVSDGLELYETTYETLRGNIGNRRRNPRPDATESE